MTDERPLYGFDRILMLEVLVLFYLFHPRRMSELTSDIPPTVEVTSIEDMHLGMNPDRYPLEM